MNGWPRSYWHKNNQILRLKVINGYFFASIKAIRSRIMALTNPIVNAIIICKTSPIGTLIKHIPFHTRFPLSRVSM